MTIELSILLEVTTTTRGIESIALLECFLVKLRMDYIDQSTNHSISVSSLVMILLTNDYDKGRDRSNWCSRIYSSRMEHK